MPWRSFHLDLGSSPSDNPERHAEIADVICGFRKLASRSTPMPTRSRHGKRIAERDDSPESKSGDLFPGPAGARRVPSHLSSTATALSWMGRPTEMKLTLRLSTAKDSAKNGRDIEKAGRDASPRNEGKRVRPGSISPKNNGKQIYIWHTNMMRPD